MKRKQLIVLLLGVLLISGCGDQVWCGEDGCNHASTPSNPSGRK